MNLSCAFFFQISSLLSPQISTIYVNSFTSDLHINYCSNRNVGIMIAALWKWIRFLLRTVRIFRPPKKIAPSPFSALCLFFCELFADHISSCSIHPLCPGFSLYPPALGIPLQCNVMNSVTSQPLQMSRPSQWSFSYDFNNLYLTFIVSLIIRFLIFPVYFFSRSTKYSSL